MPQPGVVQFCYLYDQVRCNAVTCMLLELNISDFAIIERLNLRFCDGFNVLTGETGAGKSIIIDALGTLRGGANRSLVCARRK
jgi:DNA replication and repair protein RecN